MKQEYITIVSRRQREKVTKSKNLYVIGDTEQVDSQCKVTACMFVFIEVVASGRNFITA